MAIRVERKCFDTTDEALNQLRSLGLWPTTLHLPPGRNLICIATTMTCTLMW